ncbi:Beta-galactosidase C-terminal domain [Micromonospora sp. KC721]|uniref:Beta-galactosidase C-terminal domain n=1 Tax=Micromonospora sp. KC721 TaxID=2530380 RepID=UPI001404573C|nr:Beta-galactosidase C-terminal domain [Micromonospora sp. KC721]
MLAEAGLVPRDGVPDGVELAHRAGDSASYIIAINHIDRDVELAATGKELITGTPCHGTLPVPPETSASCALLRELGPARRTRGARARPNRHDDQGTRRGEDDGPGSRAAGERSSRRVHLIASCDTGAAGRIP